MKRTNIMLTDKQHSARLYLRDKGIPVKTQEKEEILQDVANA